MLQPPANCLRDLCRDLCSGMVYLRVRLGLSGCLTYETLIYETYVLNTNNYVL